MSTHKLIIEKIETVPIQIPLSRVFKGSYYQMTHRSTIITRLYTDAGIVGEVYNGDENETQGQILKIIHDEIEPRIKGMDAFNSEGCWDIMQLPSYDILRNRSLAMQAQACVDSAIWDAIGKALDVPLYKLWGGYRNTLPTICIGGYYEPDKSNVDLGKEIEAMKQDGFAGCKFKVGGATPAIDAERVRTAREAVGDDFILAVDANQGWSAREAIEFAYLVEDYDLRWFEEPCRWYNDRQGMALVRNTTRLPIAAGQSEISRSGCRDLMASAAIDVCNFDASWGGGPTEWRRVAAMAKCYDVEMAHHEEPQVSAHLLGSIEHGTYLEAFHPDRDPLFYKLLENRSPFSEGTYTLPEGPGFGLQLDKNVIKKYRVS